VTLKPKSEPEPDIAVVRIDANEYGDRHPTPDDILWIIEVADSTVLSDRQQKARVYARARIADYWILDVNTRQVYNFSGSNSSGLSAGIAPDCKYGLCPPCLSCHCHSP
jgi:Uma2 family endonuclease